MIVKNTLLERTSLVKCFSMLKPNANVELDQFCILVELYLGRRMVLQRLWVSQNFSRISRATQSRFLAALDLCVSQSRFFRKAKACSKRLSIHAPNLTVGLGTVLVCCLRASCMTGQESCYIKNTLFTIIAEIHARSSAIFFFFINMRTDTWIWNLCDALASESGKFNNLLS